MGFTSDEGRGISMVGGSGGGFGNLLSTGLGFLTGGTSALIPGIAGALGGLFGSKSSQERIMQGPTATGIAGEQAVLQNLGQWQNYVNAGPGMQDVTAGLGSQRDLASMLQNYAQGGFLPGQSDFDTASKFSGLAFKPQEVALTQAMDQARVLQERRAGQMGRQINDPILAAKLEQQRMQGLERLGADKSAYEAQFAQNLPMQRLGFMGQLADVRGQLANQAMANRQALVSQGSQLEQISNQFRLGSAGMSQTQGGGIRDMITGGFAGIGAGLSMQGQSDRNWYNKSMYDRALSQPSASNPFISGGGFGGGMRQPQIANNFNAPQQISQPQMQPYAYNFDSGNMFDLRNTGIMGSMNAYNPQSYTNNTQQFQNFWQQRANQMGIGGL